MTDNPTREDVAKALYEADYPDETYRGARGWGNYANGESDWHRQAEALMASDLWSGLTDAAAKWREVEARRNQEGRYRVGGGGIVRKPNGGSVCFSTTEAARLYAHECNALLDASRVAPIDPAALAETYHDATLKNGIVGTGWRGLNHAKRIAAMAAALAEVTGQATPELAADLSQSQVYADTRQCGWDPHNANTLTEELMHLISEVDEVFEHIRKGVAPALIWYTDDGKPMGIPVEFADILIGLLYNAEREGFDLTEALRIKMAWNANRDYTAEGRQLHSTTALAEGQAAPAHEPAPVPYDKHEAEMMAVLKERDDAIEMADRLALAIAPQSVIGEHSNLNNPWENALEVAENRAITLAAAPGPVFRTPLTAKQMGEAYSDALAPFIRHATTPTVTREERDKAFQALMDSGQLVTDPTQGRYQGNAQEDGRRLDMVAERMDDARAAGAPLLGPEIVAIVRRIAASLRALSSPGVPLTTAEILAAYHDAIGTNLTSLEWAIENGYVVPGVRSEPSDPLAKLAAARTKPDDTEGLLAAIDGVLATRAG